MRRAQHGRVARTVRGGHGGEAQAGGRAGGTGVARRYRAARVAESRGWPQCGGAIQTCPGEQWAVALRQPSMSKGAEQEEWRNASRHRECRRLEGLRLAQAESEGHWRAVNADAGGGRWAGVRRRAARDTAARQPPARPRAWREAGGAGWLDLPRERFRWRTLRLLRDLRSNLFSHSAP